MGLDTHLTPELREEGLAREFVSRVQNLRKDEGLDVTDRITIRIRGSDKVRTVLEKQEDYIKNETLAIDMVYDSGSRGSFNEIRLNDEEVLIAIDKV